MQEARLTSNTFKEITLPQQQLVYFTLQVSKMQPPLVLHVTKYCKDQYLLIHFSKKCPAPDYQNYDFSFNELEEGSKPHMHLKLVLNDERIGRYLQEQFYLSIISNVKSKVQIAYTFKHQQPVAPQKKAINLREINKYLNSPTKGQNSLDNLPSGSQTTRIMPRYKLNYQDMKQQIGEMISDTATYRQFLQKMNKQKYDRLISGSKSARNRRNIDINLGQEEHHQPQFLKSIYESTQTPKSKTSYQQFRLSRVIASKNQLDEEDRKRKIFLLHKRTILQDYRHTMLSEAEGIRKRKSNARFFYSLIMKRRLMQYLNDKFKLRMIQQAKMNNLIKHTIKIQRFYRKMREQIFRNQYRKLVKYSYKTVGQCLNPIMEFRAKLLIKSFLQHLKGKSYQSFIFKKFYENVVSIQKRFQKHMQKVKLRKQILVKKWESEKQDLIFFLLQKNKTKKIVQLIEKLQNLENNVRDYVLNQYMQKCIVQYNAAFFKWHEQCSSKKPKFKELMERLEKLIEQENQHTDLNSEKEAITDLLEDSDENQPGLQLGGAPSKIENLDLIGFQMVTNLPQKLRRKKTTKDRIESVLITEVDFDKIQQQLVTTKLTKSQSKTTLAMRKNYQSSFSVGNMELAKKKQLLLEQTTQNGNGLYIPISLYDDQIKDLSKPPKLIYLPSQTIMHRLILRSCFFKQSFAMKIDYDIKYKIAEMFGKGS